MIESIDIIVPVYNEENNLPHVLQRLEECDFCGLKKRFIFVDDFSTDSSREFLSNNVSNEHLILFHDKNKGKGAAIATALKNVSADVVVIQDADLEYNPMDYNLLLPLIITGKADVVYGSRFKAKNSFKSFMFLSYLANTFLTVLTNILFGSKITDMETCYKAFKRESLDGIEIKSSKFDFEPEITAKLIKKGIKIQEAPITYKARGYDEGKKIKAKDALQAIVALFYYRFFD